MEFCHSMTNLKTFDLSGNHFIQFDVSLLYHVSELKIEDSLFLETLDFTQKYLTNFKTFSAKNNSKLSQFCPWIIWSSPLLQKLNLGMYVFGIYFCLIIYCHIILESYSKGLPSKSHGKHI